MSSSYLQSQKAASRLCTKIPTPSRTREARSRNARLRDDDMEPIAPVNEAADARALRCALSLEALDAKTEHINRFNQSR